MLRAAALILAAIPMVALAAMPATAASCYAVGNGPDVMFDIHIGDPYTEDELDTFALMKLRQRGVNAIRVEKWGACYRAYVRDPGGPLHMEYFNSRTLEPAN
jgi:hypothetical protein